MILIRLFPVYTNFFIRDVLRITFIQYITLNCELHVDIPPSCFNFHRSDPCPTTVMEKDDAPLLSPTDESSGVVDSDEEDLSEVIYYSSSEEENDEDDSSSISQPLLTEPRSRRVSSTVLKHQKKKSGLGVLSLGTAVLIASSKDAVFKKIFQGCCAFNACNVLCGSNLVGLVTLPILFKKDLNFTKLKAVKKRQWGVMFFATLLYSVLGPMLYLMGLQSENVTVIDAAVLSRLESLEFLLLATCFIPNSPLDLWASINALIILCGVAASIFTKPFFDVNESYFDVDEGAIHIVAGGTCFVGSLLLTKRFLSKVPVGILGMFRVSMGTVVYHIQAMIRHDEKNEGYLTAELWENLWWFALLYVTLFQAVWLYALQNAKSVHISVGTTGIFLLSLIWAYAIIPGTALSDPQKLSCGIIAAGVISGIVRGARGGANKEDKAVRVKTKGDLVEESKVGTRAVI